MRNFFLTTAFILFSTTVILAQELDATISVVSGRVNNTINKSTFATLQNALNNFLNNRKWGKDIFDKNEKIKCNFLLNVESTGDANVYSGFLTIQAARPIFNSGHLSPIINFKDDNIMFKYVEFQQLDFNENRVAGNQPLESNLTAIFAYYANIILAFDYSSFSLRGGDPFFLKAQNIINNAPDSRGISGWKAFDGLRNRYWLVENMLNARYASISQIYYDYYRKVLDKMYENSSIAGDQFVKLLGLLERLNRENPNTMVNQFFLQSKSSEFLSLLKNVPQADKANAIEILSKYDLTNASAYRAAIK